VGCGLVVAAVAGWTEGDWPIPDKGARLSQGHLGERSGLHMSMECCNNLCGCRSSIEKFLWVIFCTYSTAYSDDDRLM
jgi:hypothetical protein